MTENGIRYVLQYKPDIPAIVEALRQVGSDYCSRTYRTRQAAINSLRRHGNGEVWTADGENLIAWFHDGQLMVRTLSGGAVASRRPA